MKRLISWDLETFLIGKMYDEPYGWQGIAPIPVCLSYQERGQEPLLVKDYDNMHALVLHWLEDDRVIMVGQNIAFDLFVAVQHLDIPIELVFAKYNKGLVRDTMIRELLLALATGEAVRNPGKQYSLAAHVKKYLKQDISATKGEDAWRLRYSELYEVPLEDWPDEAVEYPLDDARYTLQVFAHQHKHLHYFKANELKQTRAGFDLHLISAKSPRVHGPSIEAFIANHSEQVTIAQKPLIRKGILKPNPNRYTRFEKGDPRREGYSMDTKMLKRLVQADYTKQGRVVPGTPTGDISLAGDTLKGCITPVLKRYGEAATDIKMMDAFAPMLTQAAESETQSVSPRYGVILKTGRTSCVKGDTLILTESGHKAISKITEEDRVWTHKGRWQQVLGTSIHEAQPMVTLDFSDGGSLTCTLGHRLLNSQGTWITVESLLDECFEEVGRQCRESGKSGGAVQTSTSDNERRANSSAVGDFSTQCPGSGQAEIYRQGTQDAEVSEVVASEKGRLEPHEGQDGRAASKLRRGLFGLQGVPNESTQREEAVRTSHSYGPSVGIGESSQGATHTSHQRRPSRQQVGQFGTSDSEGARDYTFFTAQGLPGYVCTQANFSGLHPVYDIGVEEDHSYYAGGVYNHNCSQPNMQQLPKAPGARECFIPPHGKVFVAIDFSSMEMFCLAQNVWLLYGSRKMLDVLNAGHCPHVMIAANTMGINFPDAVVLYAEYEKLKDEASDQAKLVAKYRQFGKIQNFGYAGGMGAKTTLGNMDTATLQLLKELYPGQDLKAVVAESIKQWKQQWELGQLFNKAGRLTQGGTRPTYTCPITGRIKALNTYCQYCNMHFQPSGADALKEALRIIQESCWSKEGVLYLYGVELQIEIHDEVVLAGPVEGLQAWVEAAQGMMVAGAQVILKDCKVRTDAEVTGTRWSKKGLSVADYLDKLNA